MRYAPKTRRFSCEPLESRWMLSTIAWINKGTGPNAGDTDSFNDIYGANATRARDIGQRAIDDWKKVIVDFNYPSGSNFYGLKIYAAQLGGGLRGETAWPVFNAIGQPTDTYINFDDNGGGDGWWF